MVARNYQGTTGDAIRRVLRNRDVFADTRSWWASARSAACIAFPWAPVPGRGRVETVRTRDGEHFAVRIGASDLSVLYELQRQREYDAALDEITCPLEVRCVVDMGANVGLSMRFWLKSFPNARVVGIEPDAGNLAMCRENLSLCGGGAARASLIQAFVGGERRTAAVDRRRGAWGYRMAEGGGGGESIPVVTVQDVLDRVDGDVDLLKMDIEGAEAEVFARPAPWLARVKTLVVEVHPPFSSEALSAALARGPGEWRVRPLRSAGAGTVLECVNSAFSAMGDPAEQAPEVVVSSVGVRAL